MTEIVKVRRTFRIPESVYNIFTHEASATGLSVQDWLIMCGLAQAGRIVKQECVEHVDHVAEELSREGKN